MVIVEFGGWQMLVPVEVAEDAGERAKVVALLRMISEIKIERGESE